VLPGGIVRTAATPPRAADSPAPTGRLRRPPPPALGLESVPAPGRWPGNNRPSAGTVGRSRHGGRAANDRRDRRRATRPATRPPGPGRRGDSIDRPAGRRPATSPAPAGAGLPHWPRPLRTGRPLPVGATAPAEILPGKGARRIPWTVSKNLLAARR